MEKRDWKRCIDVWETPAGFSIGETFPLHWQYHIPAYRTEYFLEDQTETIRTNHWTLFWRFPLNIFELRSQLVVDCNAIDMKVNKLIIQQYSAKCDVFPGRPLRAGKIERSYIRKLDVFKPSNAKAGPTNVWKWRHVCRCRRFFSMGIYGFEKDSGLHRKGKRCVASTSLFLIHANQ